MTTSISEQARALERSAGVRARDDLVLLRVTGDDRLDWLNGQLTNDVREAKDGAGVYALAVNVRGKIMADVWALERGPELAVLVPKAALAQVMASFEQQIIMEDVALTPDPELCVISVQGPRSLELLDGMSLEIARCDELGAGGAFALVPASQLEDALRELTQRAARIGGARVGDEGFELARLRAGRPRFGRDFDQRNYPQEAGLKHAAVSFNKGCYLGQEVVCTLENRGRLSRRLMRLEAAAGALLTEGAELRDSEGHVAGELRSVALDPEAERMMALGYIKAANAVPGELLHANEAALTVRGAAGDAN